MTDKQIIIDGSKCEWRTGVEHCGDYECMLNKCCDYNCDWYKRRKLEQQLEAKEQECEALREEKAYTDMACEQSKKELDQLKADFEQYKRSKQASYEAIQTKCNELELKNRKLESHLATLDAVIETGKAQYKELQAENDSIKSELMQTNCYLDADKEIINKLKAENEELKKQACGLRPELKYIIDKTCSKYNINAKCYHEKIIKIINNLDKYKQTLDEIKEIAESCGWNFGSEILYKRIEYILQEISEVIPDEN